MFLGGCPCCGGKVKDEECCFCSNVMLQRDYWDNLSGDYGETGTVFDSRKFFEASVVVGWGDEVVWSGVMPGELVLGSSASTHEFSASQPTSGIYKYINSDNKEVQISYAEPVVLHFNMSTKLIWVTWGGMKSDLSFNCGVEIFNDPTKERGLYVRQPSVGQGTEDYCEIGVRSSYSNISGVDVNGDSLDNVDCGIPMVGSPDTTVYNNANCGLGVISQVFARYQYEGADGDVPCFAPTGGIAFPIPQQYIEVTLTVKDERLGTISPCYTSNQDDPDTLNDGSITGLCNGRPVDLETFDDDYCSIQKECNCNKSAPHSNDKYGTDLVFLPGETTTCKCCCFLSNANTATLDGTFLINEANATFQEGSPFDGLKALVFVTDGTDPNFGDEVRVVAMVAERSFGFTLTDFFEDNTGYSFLFGTYTAPSCGSVYEECFFNVFSCRRGNYLQHEKQTEYVVPAYRSQPFDPAGPHSFEEWKVEQVTLALGASCNSPEWEWNWYVDQYMIIDEKDKVVPFELRWLAGYSNGEGKTFANTFQTTDGPLEITGNLEVTQIFDDECGYAGDCEFPTQTADIVTLPVTDEECCRRGGGTFTPNPNNANRASTMTTKTIGPGSHLANLFKWFGIHAKEKGCKCAHMEKKMNKNGPQWCRDHMPEILDHLAKEAKKRKLPFVRLAAEKLVRMAIRKAEKDSA